MPGKNKRPPVPPAGNPRDEIGTTRVEIPDIDVNAASLFEVRPQQRGRLSFPARRVDGVEPNQRLRQLDELGGRLIV